LLQTCYNTAMGLQVETFHASHMNNTAHQLDDRETIRRNKNT
jgi:hypothetical protein